MNQFNFSSIEGKLTDDPAYNEYHKATVLRLCSDREINRTYIDVHCTGKLGTVCQEYLRKGVKVLVSGHLLSDDKGSHFIKGTEVNFLSSK